MNVGLKKIDWYIIKKFIMTFFIALLLIIGIVIIFDISEKINHFVENKAPLHAIVFDYYVNFVPYFVNMFSPLFVFITVIFFTSRMAANSEIIAILSCGVSYKRMMVPYMVSALLIATLSLSLNLWVIPRANVKRINFELKYIKHRNSLSSSNVHYQINPGRHRGQQARQEDFRREGGMGQHFQWLETEELLHKGIYGRSSGPCDHRCGAGHRAEPDSH